ncbi:MAG TPA: hypothetical protein VNS58_23390 [Puia sp.]|nr:hypothetical protein [Puia sp.]
MLHRRHPFPVISRRQFVRQVPSIKRRFLYNQDYARAGLDDISRGWSKEGILQLTCNETRTCYFENLGHGKFVKHVLPVEAQIAPVNSILCEDFDHDGYKDILRRQYFLFKNLVPSEIIQNIYFNIFSEMLFAKNLF